MSPLRHRSVFGAKSAENGELRKVRFFVSGVKCAAWASKFACFRSKSGSACSELRFLPRKACEFQPAELVTACFRFVTARFLGAKVRKTGPSSGTRSPQGFPRSDSPARTWLGARQPAEVLPRNTSACRTCHRRCHRCGLVQQSAGTLDLHSTQIRATAFEGESVSVTDLLADSLALTGSATLDGLTAQGNVGCDQLLCKNVNCTDVFTTGVDASGAVSCAALTASPELRCRPRAPCQAAR